MNQTTKRTLNELVEAHLTSIISNSISIARHSKRRCRTVHASDVLSALRLEGSSLELSTNAGYTDNTPVDLNEFLDRDIDEQMEAPVEIGMVMHWLAVEGRQPATPFNPVRSSQDGNGAIVSDKEYEGDDNEDEDASGSDANNGNVSVRNLLPRLLSEDLQLYFIRITNTLRHGDTQAQDAALQRLRYDGGIQELVPFFLNVLTPTANSQMANVQYSRLRIQCIHNMILNPHIHLELYLEKVVPLIINCIVPKKLSFSPYDHWKLRDEASYTLLTVWNIFGEKYSNFRSNVIRILCTALTKGNESQYGALIALSDLGPKVVDAVVLPTIDTFWTDCETQLNRCQDNGVRFGLQRVQDALLVSCITLLLFGFIIVSLIHYLCFQRINLSYLYGLCCFNKYSMLCPFSWAAVL